MVAAITGRMMHEEAQSEGRTYDAIAGIRATRMKWLGSILRMDKTRMIHKAVKTLYQNRQQGDLLMDAPVSHSWEDLVKQAEDEKQWRGAVKEIKDMTCMKAVKGHENKKQKIKKKGAGAEVAAAPSRTDKSETKSDESDKGESGSDDEGRKSWGLGKRKRV